MSFVKSSRSGVGVPRGAFALLPMLVLFGAPVVRAAAPATPAETEFLVPPGELPSYETLRFQGGEETELVERFLASLPTRADDIATTSVVFPQVPPTATYARMNLQSLIDTALASNFSLQRSQRGLKIARSSTSSSEADFIPYVDLVGGSRFRGERDANARRTDSSGDRVQTVRENNSIRNNAGVESGVNLPTGGSITVTGDQARTDSNSADGNRISTEDRTFESTAEVRFLQPLLRGGGTDVGTAALRRARLREADTILQDQITQRDVAFDVIEGYFSLLQTARQIRVSLDAIAERQRFLEETRVKFNVGRVDESEILRAEIQYLSELETAVGRRRALDDQREQLLILLGLPLETPISFVDITDTLAGRGRVDIPDVQAAVDESRSRRLELMREDISIALSEIDVRTTRNDVLPRLDFDAGYGRRDADDRYADATGFEDSTWDAGLSLRVPLINIQRREAARRASLSLEQDRIGRTELERRLTQSVISAHRSVLATEAQLTLLRKNVEQARKTLSLINGRFEVGFASVTEVRLAQDDLFAAETRYSNTLLNYQVQIARLYVAIGRSLI